MKDMTNERNVQPSELLEPFACPHCGQMLGPTCRVCVACGQPIELSQIARRDRTAPFQAQSRGKAPAGRRTQFSWLIFFTVLAITLVLMSVAFRLIGIETSERIFVGFTFICAGWVFLDARSKAIPRPWRWSVMTICFWIVFFSWYVSRRRSPETPCAVIEDPTSVVFRALFWFVLILLFLSFLAAVVKSPPL
jgi:hypothetical protein